MNQIMFAILAALLGSVSAIFAGVIMAVLRILLSDARRTHLFEVIRTRGFQRAAKTFLWSKAGHPKKVPAFLNLP